MTIETKYNIGDKVFFLCEGRIRSGIISSYIFYCSSITEYSYKNRKVEIPNSIITYVIDHEYERYEEELFLSKEELINDLENCEGMKMIRKEDFGNMRECSALIWSHISDIE